MPKSDKSYQEKVVVGQQRAAAGIVKLTDFSKAYPYVVCVLIPVMIYFIYAALIQSERYESRAQLTIQQVDSAASMDPSLALVAGLAGGAPVTQDSSLVSSYIHSVDMLNLLDDEINLREHYSASSIDVFSRLSDNASAEQFHQYYIDHSEVSVDALTGIIIVRVQAFDADYAYRLNEAITRFSEEYINSIGHDLAQQQLQFLEGESMTSLDNLRATQRRLIEFQAKYDLLDPEAEGMARQQITYNVESQISVKESQLNALLETMTPNATSVIQARAELDALRQQLNEERSRLSEKNSTGEAMQSVPDLPLSEILARYANHKLELEMALQAYAASQMSIEAARVNSLRQAKFLMKIEAPTLPEDDSYPTILYNVLLLLSLLTLVFGMGRIVVLTVQELG